MASPGLFATFKHLLLYFLEGFNIFNKNLLPWSFRNLILTVKVGSIDY